MSPQPRTAIAAHGRQHPCVPPERRALTWSPAAAPPISLTCLQTRSWWRRRHGSSPTSTCACTWTTSPSRLPDTSRPTSEHMTKLLDFAQAWGGQGPMVIHCWAGISRSTAAALISLCALNPKAPEAIDRAAPARGVAHGLSQPPDDTAGRRRARAQRPHHQCGGIHGARNRHPRGAALLAACRFFRPCLKLSSIRARCAAENCHDQGLAAKALIS